MNVRASLLGALRPLRKIKPLYNLFLGCGLSPLSKRIRERAVASGYEARFRMNRIELRKEGRDIWFALEDAGHLWWIIPRLEFLQGRFIYRRRGTRQVVDARGEQRYKIPGTEDFAWMPGLPEAVDLLAGYFAHGQPEKGSVAFDCGAFCGEITLVLARMVGPTGRVYSFEPDSRSRARLARNIAEAGLNNVTIVDKGLWKESTTLDLAVDGLASHLSVHQVEGKTVKVPVLSFEDACTLAGAIPSFVKMDIEGAEVEAIEGGLAFIARHRIRFSIASYHDRGGHPTSALLEPLFRQAGYEVTSGYPDHPTTWASRS